MTKITEDEAGTHKGADRKGPIRSFCYNQLLPASLIACRYSA